MSRNIQNANKYTDAQPRVRIHLFCQFLCDFCEWLENQSSIELGLEGIPGNRLDRKVQEIEVTVSGQWTIRNLAKGKGPKREDLRNRPIEMAWNSTGP